MLFDTGRTKSALCTQSEKPFLWRAFKSPHTERKTICFVPGFASSSSISCSRFCGGRISTGTPSTSILCFAIHVSPQALSEAQLFHTKLPFHSVIYLLQNGRV